MAIHPFSDQEQREDLPHVILTSELDWDPGQLDVALEDDDGDDNNNNEEKDNNDNDDSNDEESKSGFSNRSSDKEKNSKDCDNRSEDDSIMQITVQKPMYEDELLKHEQNDSVAMDI